MEHTSSAKQNVCVIGATGGIGRAFVEALAQRPSVARVHALSRRGTDGFGEKVVTGRIDVTDAASIERAAEAIDEPLDLVIVATGILHADDGLEPEKTYRSLDAESLARVLQINTIGPAVVARHFVPKLRAKSRSVFAALSARVGSIADNRLGGWYSYRASKAALNMILRSLAIEVARRHREAVVVGLHPGTVDTGLSAPFQGNVPAGKLFEPAYSATRLLEVIDGLDAADSGRVFDYAGKPVPE